MEQEFLWTKQLYKEYKNILWQYKLPLRETSIKIESLQSTYGRFDPLTRTISISSHLIKNYSWDKVLEILKHEMAHQLACEVYHCTEGHGEVFIRACENLRVAPWARRASIQLDTNIDDISNYNPSEKEDGLLRKIQKLLNLANSSNPNEALAAMRKSKELCEKYQLEQQNTCSDHKSIIINHKKKRIHNYQTALISLLISHYHVEAIFSSLYDQTTDDVYKVVEILGNNQNATLAEYVYWFIINNLPIFWQEYWTSKEKTIKAKHQYYLGVINGFDKKLTQEKIKEKKIETSPIQKSKNELLSVTKNKLENYVNYRYPRLSSRKVASCVRVGKAYYDGINKGETLNLHHGLKNKTNSYLIERF